MRRTILTLLIAACLPLGCRPPEPEAPSPGPPVAPVGDGPRLVLVLVVDQFGADYFDRYGHLFTGGLARLERDGVRFTDARHRHAITHTSPGHATLVTGVHPRRHGVVANWWVPKGDRHLRAAVDDDGHGESPLRLEMPTLGDWIRRRSPMSKVYAVSRKDRAAIFLSGLTANGAYWYDDETGDLVTSTYWGATQPDWVREFNRRHLLDDYFGRVWEPLPLPEDALAELSLETLDMGPLQPGFPHAIGRPALAPDEMFYDALIDTPWLDEHLLRFARHAIEANDLGRDGAPDLLAVGLSALDSVGHGWGSDSRQVLDHLLRLDLWLGEFLDWLDASVGLDHVILGLSADHGVAPIPELRALRGLPGGRATHVETACLQNAARRVAATLGVDRVLLPGGYLAPGLTETTGRDRPALEALVAREAESCPRVERVWTRSELERGPVGGDPMQELWANSYHPGMSPDFLVQFEEFFMPRSGTATTHMTPYDYDTAVPMVFLAPGLAPGLDDRPVATVDFAPTLAGLLGVDVAADLDGRDLFANRD